MMNARLSFRSDPSHSQTLDYDVLYEQLEAHIQSEVRRLQAVSEQWLKLSYQRPVVLAIEKQYISLMDRHVKILGRLKQIEAELDCVALHQVLIPFDNLIAQLHNHLVSSWRLIDLYENLETHQQWLSEQLSYAMTISQLAADFSFQKFEDLLEDSEQIGEELAKLSQAPAIQSELKAKHTRLNEYIVLMQDLLDQSNDEPWLKLKIG